jgi:hypothetical protein
MERKFNLVLVALLFFVGPTLAQQVTGNLEGRILSLQGEPLAEVNVVINSPSLQGERGAVSDARGYFRAVAIPAGVYTVKISHIGYQGIIYENIAIQLGKTTTLGEIRLAPKSIEMPEVVIYGANPVIDPTSTTVGANLTSSTFAPLPTERNFRSVVTLLPQANTSYLGDETNIAGSTGLENIYFIDGMNVTDPYRGVSSTNLPFNFVREIEVKTGGYEAEFGRALGGIINVITYSGGNKFHGNIFGFYTGNRLVAEARRGLIKVNTDAFARYDLGFSLGGPILHDKLWFFTAYNPNFEREEVEIPGIGVHDDKKTTHIFSGKLSWHASANTNLAFTVVADPSERTRVGHNSPAPFNPSGLKNIDPFLGI